MGLIMNSETEILIKQNNKLNSLIFLMSEWISLYQKNKCLSTFFDHYKYNTVAIYGMGVLGERLFDELKEHSINISFCIDNNILNIFF